MARPLTKLGEFRRVYDASSNPEKDKITQSAIDQIKSLIQVPKEE